MNEAKVFVKTEMNGVVNEFNGESVIIINIKGIEKVEVSGRKEKLGVDASIGVIGRKYDTNIAPDLYASLFSRVIENLGGNAIEKAFLLSEVGDHLKKVSDEIMFSLSAEEFAKMASESLTELFRDVFKK